MDNPGQEERIGVGLAQYGRRIIGQERIWMMKNELTYCFRRLQPGLFCTVFLLSAMSMSACSDTTPGARPNAVEPGEEQPAQSEGWALAVVDEPSDGTAGEEFTASFQLVDDHGEALNEGGVEVELLLNQHAFADGEQQKVSLTNRQGIAHFELTIERAATDYQLQAMAVSDEGESAEVKSSLFRISAADPWPQASSITGGQGYVGDAEGAPIRVELIDVYENPVVGVVPVFRASGEGNDYKECTESDGFGVSLCAMTSTEVGEKALELVEPVEFSGGTVSFLDNTGLRLVSAIAEEQVAGEPFGVEVQVLSSSGRVLREAGIELNLELNRGEFAGGATTLQAVTDGAGVAEIEVSIEEAAQDYALIITSTDERFVGRTLISGDFDVVPAGASADTSSIRSEQEVGIIRESMPIVIELRDEFGNPLIGEVPVFAASGEGNRYDLCSAADEKGHSTCGFKSTRGGEKVLELVEPIELEGETIFIRGPAKLEIVEAPSASVVAGDSFMFKLQVVDHRDDPFSAADIPIEVELNKHKFASGQTKFIMQTDVDGVAAWTTIINKADVGYMLTATSGHGELSETAAESPPFEVVAGSASAQNSWITGTDGFIRDVEVPVEIGLFDEFDNPVVDITPTFSATGEENSYASCSATGEEGVYSCGMTSTKSGKKTLSIDTPIYVLGDTIEIGWKCDPLGDPFGGGSGSEEDPYIICAAEQLQSLNGIETRDQYFVLATDIAMSDIDWAGISTFEGALDGEGKIIYDLMLERSGQSGIAIFNMIGQYGEVKNIYFEDISVIGRDGLAGLAVENYGRIKNVSLHGEIDASGRHVAGLVVSNIGVVEEVSTDVMFRASTEVGGLVMYNVGEVRNSYSVAYMDIFSGAIDRVGGIAVENDGIVKNSHSSVYVSSNHAKGDGGGGLLAINRGEVTRSYWDIDVTPHAMSAGGTGLKTGGFSARDQFNGWNFDEVWVIGEAPDGETRPILQWQVKD